MIRGMMALFALLLLSLVNAAPMKLTLGMPVVVTIKDDVRKKSWSEIIN